MSGKIIDLTLKMTDAMPVYPGDAPVSIEPYHQISRDGANTTKISLGTHTGTHLDAPWHFIEEGLTVDEISLEQCMGPAVVIDLSMKTQGDLIEISDLKHYERFIGEKARLLMRTDWSKRFGDESYYEDWPALTEEACEWLRERGIGLLGMETPSVDLRHQHQNHQILLGAGVVLIEGLANLDALTLMRVFFSALPLSLVGIDGSPVRAVAVEERPGHSDLKALAVEETLQEARPYSASLSLGRPPVLDLPTIRRLLKG